MVGRMLVHDHTLSIAERIYVAMFGVPVSGLRIRFRRLSPYIKRAVEQTKGSHEIRVGDFGCGIGVFSMEIARRFPQTKVTGFDIDYELIEKNNKLVNRAGIHNCQFELEDAVSLKTSLKFDVCICIDVLEHMVDDRAALVRMRQLSKAQAFLIVHVPGYYRRWLFWSRRINFDVEGHVRPGYTKEEISKKIIEAGFRILDARYTYGWIETFTNNISYLITGAQRKNRYWYALIFPILNFFAFWGQWSVPSWGAGVAVLATPDNETNNEDTR